MAKLTNAQKSIFDYKLSEFLKTLKSDDFEISVVDNIFEDIRINEINYRNITASLDRLEYTYHYAKGKISNLKYNPDNNIKSIKYYNDFKKEKNILSFGVGLRNKDIIIQYDFNTKKYTSFETYTDNNHYLDDITELVKNEWIFNYVRNLNQVKNICDELVACGISCDTMPKNIDKHIIDGYLQNSFYSEYIMINLVKNLKYQNAVEFLTRNMGYRNTFNVLKILNIESLLKMAKNSISNGNFGIKTDLFDLCDLIVSLGANVVYENSLIDTNRDLIYNVDTLKDYKDREKNELLAKRLQKLNFINNMTFGENNEYTVVVPQSQRDKTNEGKQQNNCVGYYYDDSILRGENLIYFLRKSDNTKKSYITCRYNLRSENTVEYRLKNNNCVSKGSTDELIIKQISNIIKEHFTKEREEK